MQGLYTVESGCDIPSKLRKNPCRGQYDRKHPGVTLSEMALKEGVRNCTSY